MSLIPLGVFTVLIAILDQISKYLVIKLIDFGEVVDCVPGLFHLTYVKNTGAAFSMLEGQQWLFVLVFIAFVGLLVWSVRKKLLPFKTFELWCLAAVLGGGLGNIIDRLRLGYVVDMIEVEFITFPVFNVADCFITCGAIGLLLHLVLCNREFWKEEKKTES